MGVVASLCLQCGASQASSSVSLVLNPLVDASSSSAWESISRDHLPPKFHPSLLHHGTLPGAAVVISSTCFILIVDLLVL